MSTDKMETTPEQALEASVETMKECAKPMELASGVEDWLKRETHGKFVQHFDRWPVLRDRVLESSCAIGKIALTLARLEGTPTIERAAVSDAIKAVKNHCRARTEEPRLSERPDFVFCPDLP